MYSTRVIFVLVKLLVTDFMVSSMSSVINTTKAREKIKAEIFIMHIVNHD